MKAWWFAPDDGKLRYDDRRKPRKGYTHYVPKDRPLVLCEYGLHASVEALDALGYAPGSQAWRVELGKPAPGYDPVILMGDDKAVAYERTYIAKVPNSEAVLWKFARLCALDVIHLWDAPGVVVRYLRTGDESIRYAAWAAAKDAAWAAAWAAAKDAAWAAAWAAAKDAARAAAWAAARAAARDVTRGKQNRRLHRMLMEAIRKV